MFSATFEAALRATGIPAAHWSWGKDRTPQGDHIVWAEDAPDDLVANGLHAERATSGTVDLFTRAYDGTTAAQVEAALESLPHAVWEQLDPLYEDDTEFVHYIWRVAEYGENRNPV